VLLGARCASRICARLARTNDFPEEHPREGAGGALGDSQRALSRGHTAYDILRHNGVDLGQRDFLNGGRDW